MTSTKMTQTHIEHPEDTILTGDLSAIEALYCKDSKVSMKMDGMSLVWGTNPENGKFFVCTKAAFNKKKDRKCYNHDDLYTHFGHQMEVFDILSHCLKYLPRTDNIYWGDWLGFGRTHVMQQNTLTYVFAHKPYQKLVIAPHTKVTVTGDFCDAQCEQLNEIFDDTNVVKWVQPSVDRMPPTEFDITDLDTGKVQFMTPSEASVALRNINGLIREGVDLTDAVLLDVLGDIYLVNLYLMVIEMKEEVMDSFIVSDAPMSFIYDDIQVDGEGFVITNEYGTYKLVDRPCFAYANFNSGKFAKN
tara:strand:- start:1702 stop:2607 length:906 start_codon:yes stop_codon:yes gene_type:complete